MEAGLLCIRAHSHDLEVGCGRTIPRLLRLQNRTRCLEGPPARVSRERVVALPEVEYDRGASL
jgi:hypothetical protein